MTTSPTAPQPPFFGDVCSHSLLVCAQCNLHVPNQQAEITRLIGQLQEASDQRDSALALVSHKDTHIAELNGRLRQATEQHAAALAAMSANAERVALLTRQLEQTTTRQERASAALLEREEEIEQLKRAMNTMSASSDLHAKDREIERLRTKTSSFETRLVEEERAVRALRTHASASDARLLKLGDELVETQKRLERTDATRRKIVNARNSLEAELQDEREICNSLRAEKKGRISRIRWFELVHRVIRTKTPDSSLQIGFSRGTFFVSTMLGLSRTRTLKLYSIEVRRSAHLERLFRTSSSNFAQANARNMRVAQAAKEGARAWEQALPKLARCIDVKALSTVLGRSSQSQYDKDRELLRDFCPVPSARAVLMAARRLDTVDNAVSKPEVLKHVTSLIKNQLSRGKVWYDDNADFYHVDKGSSDWFDGYESALGVKKSVSSM